MKNLFIFFYRADLRSVLYYVMAKTDTLINPLTSLKLEREKFSLKIEKKIAEKASNASNFNDFVFPRIACGVINLQHLIQQGKTVRAMFFVL